MNSNVHQSMPINMYMNLHELQKIINEMVTLKSEIKLICSKLNVLTKSVMLHTKSRNMTVTASPGVQREHGQAERDSGVKVSEEKAQSDPVVDTLEPKRSVVGRKTKTSWNHDGLDKDGKGRMEPLMDVSVIKMETCMDSYKGNIETCMDSYSGNAVDRTTEFEQDTQLVCVDSRTEQLSSGSVILSSKGDTVMKHRKGSGQWEETCADGHTLEDSRTQYRKTGLRKPGENSLKTEDNGLVKSVNTLNINVSLNCDAQEALNCVKNKEIKIENIFIDNTVRCVDTVLNEDVNILKNGEHLEYKSPEVKEDKSQEGKNHSRHFLRTVKVNHLTDADESDDSGDFIPDTSSEAENSDPEKEEISAITTIRPKFIRKL